MNWRHNDLTADLASHLRGTNRLVWEDMQLGPVGSPRPDVYTIARSFAKFHPLAYECKVSVADFRRDVTAGKWQAYLNYASAVIFAVPRGLVGKADIPRGCGLMVRGDAGWKTVKGPTLSFIETLPRSAWLKLLIDGIERQRREYHPRIADRYKTEKAARERYGAAVANALSDRYSAEEKLRLAEQRMKLAAEEANAKRWRIIENARDSARRDMEGLWDELHTAASALGLPRDTPGPDVIRAIRDAAARVDESAEVRRLTLALERVRDSAALAVTCRRGPGPA